MAEETSKIGITVSNLMKKAETTLGLINDTNIETQESLKNAKIDKKKEEERTADMMDRIQKQENELANQR